jgi:hypothetical protein
MQILEDRTVADSAGRVALAAQFDQLRLERDKRSHLLLDALNMMVE